MKLYSYVLVSDSGFAPNPFDNFCTLATCKPIIRKNANVGDLVIGTGSRNNVGNDKLIYAMKITEKMNFNDYFNDNRFTERSDNIYYLDNGSWKQKNTNNHESMDDIKRDLSGLYVLVSDNFYYFGKKAIKIPLEFKELIKKGPGHKSNFNQDFIEKFIKWLEMNYRRGMQSKPYDFPSDKCSKKNIIVKYQ